MDTVMRAHQIIRARDYLAAGLRTTAVRLVTGLPENVVKDLYEQVWGCRPKQGRDPDVSSIVRTLPRLAEASALASLYIQAVPSYQGDMDIDALLAAYAVFTDHCKARGREPALTVHHAWLIVRDLRCGLARMEKCQKCRSPYLVVACQHFSPRCPYCAPWPSQPSSST